MSTTSTAASMASTGVAKVAPGSATRRPFPRPVLLPEQTITNPVVPTYVVRQYDRLWRSDPLERPALAVRFAVLAAAVAGACLLFLPDGWRVAGALTSLLALWVAPMIGLPFYVEHCYRDLDARYTLTLKVPVAAQRAWERFDVAAAQVRRSHAPTDMLSDIAAVAPIMDDLRMLARTLRKQEHAGHDELLEVVAQMERLADEAEAFAQAAATYRDDDTTHRLDAARSVSLTAPVAGNL